MKDYFRKKDALTIVNKCTSYQTLESSKKSMFTLYLT